MKNEEKQLPLKDVAQICILVPDIEKAVEIWWKKFGIGPWHLYTYGKPLVKRMTRHGKPCEYKMKIALSYIGKMRIELIEPLEGDTVYKESIEVHGYGVHHLGVLTDDMKLLKHWRASLKDGNSIVCFDNLPLAPVSIEVVCELIGNLIKKRPSGIFHMSAANDITYHELAQRVGFKMGADNNLIHRDRASAANLNLFTLPKHATLEMSVESRILRIVAPPAEQALAQLGL